MDDTVTMVLGTGLPSGRVTSILKKMKIAFYEGHRALFTG